MKAFVLQMTSAPDSEENITFIRQTLEQTEQALNGGLVLLPECFAMFGGGDKKNLALAEAFMETPSDDSVQGQLAGLAKEFGIYLVAGTFPIKAENNKVKPMTLVYGPNGEYLTQYQKIHLFDVDVEDSTGSYRESDTWQPGEKVAYFDTPWGRIGLAICYDLRFPSLFQNLTSLGCHAVLLPSAFTEKTGQAHWQVLIRARAIENQIYMIASDQTGIHNNNRETHGHSMIVDPWGTILVDAEKETGLFSATLNMDVLNKVRKAMPVGQHNKFTVRYK